MSMYYKGFVKIALILTISVLAASGTYIVITQDVIINQDQDRSIDLDNNEEKILPNETEDDEEIENIDVSSSGIVSIKDLKISPELYVDKNIKVAGKMVVNVYHGLGPCPTEGVCDTSLGAELMLWETDTKYGVPDKTISIYKGDEPYPCEKIEPATYKCGPYTSGVDVETVLSAKWIAKEIPVAWTGSSGGQAPEPFKWETQYFLSVE